MPDSTSLRRFTDLLQSGLSIRLVYGESVQQGATTAIPVARVAYGLGAGGGGGTWPAAPGAGAAGADTKEAGEREGFGGGVGALMVPVGAFEVGPRGVRFVPVRPLMPLLTAAGVGLVVGWALGRRRW